MARRARRLWGFPPALQRLALRGIGHQLVAEDGVRGEWLARATGCRVFSADYRLAPESRFPAAFDDVAAVYQWLVTGGAPGERIAIAGESAGGGLVLALAVHARGQGWPAPACVVAFSPWTDLAGTGESVHGNAGRCAMFHPDNISAFAGYRLCCCKWARLSCCSTTPAGSMTASSRAADRAGSPCMTTCLTPGN